jgi:hypothetical protein
MRVKVTAYSDEAALLELLEKKYQFFNFKETSLVSSAKLHSARRACEQALEPTVDSKGEQVFKTPANTTDFGMVVAAALEPYLICASGKSAEHWEPESGNRFGRWRVAEDGEKVVMRCTRNILLEIFGDCRLVWREGKLVPTTTGSCPPQCKRRGFYAGVAADVALVLYRAEPCVRLDGVEHRRFLMDSRGVIYDHVEDKFHVNNPFIRVSRHMPWAFFDEGGVDFKKGVDVWSAPLELKNRIGDCFRGIFDFWLSGEGPQGKSLHKNAIFGQPLLNSLLGIVRENVNCGLWNLIGPIFDWDVDEILWELLHLTADIFAWERRTEWRYLYGDGATGKDVLGLLRLYALGDRAEGGMSTLFEPSYLVGKQTTSSGIDTTLDQAKGMRSVVCNEIPEHTFFGHDRVKGLVEPRGVGLLSRTIYAKPERWWPCLGLLCLSNHELALVGAQVTDTGNRRRLNVLRLRHVFEEQGLRDIKTEIMSGKYNKELFFVTRLLLDYLKRCPVMSRRILPRPPRVEEETNECFTKSSARPLKDYMEDFCEPATSYAQGTPAADIKEKLAAVIGVEYLHRQQNADLEREMSKNGITEARNGSKRVLLYTFPGHTRMRPVKLKEVEGPAAPAEP